MHNPNDIKSQDDLNEGKRSSSVLLEAIEKCERLQKQLDVAVDALKLFANSNRLDFAYIQYSQDTLKQIKELEK